MEHAAKISLINGLARGLAAVIAVLCSHNGYHWALAINVTCCMMMCFYWNTLRQVIVTSQFLGAVFAVGFIMACFSSFTTLGMYMMIVAEFHFCEFHVIAICNPGTLSFASFVINIRKFQIGVMVSWMEYLLEYMLYPDMKAFSLFSVFGLTLIIGGELIRKAAMITAGLNYTHEIARRKTDSHKLVTTGLYSWARHPAYVGSFYNCVGVQLLLCNPIGAVYETIVTWQFFKARIYTTRNRC